MTAKGNRNAVTHGCHAIEAHGLDGVPADLWPRELELLQNLATRQGVLSELERLVAIDMLIVEAGAAYLRGLDGNVWNQNGKPAGVLRHLASWTNAAARGLRMLAELRDEKQVIDGVGAMCD